MTFSLHGTIANLRTDESSVTRWVSAQLLLFFKHPGVSHRKSWSSGRVLKHTTTFREWASVHSGDLAGRQHQLHWENLSITLHSYPGLVGIIRRSMAGIHYGSQDTTGAVYKSKSKRCAGTQHWAKLLELTIVPRSQRVVYLCQPKYLKYLDLAVGSRDMYCSLMSPHSAHLPLHTNFLIPPT